MSQNDFNDFKRWVLKPERLAYVNTNVEILKADKPENLITFVSGQKNSLNHAVTMPNPTYAYKKSSTLSVTEGKEFSFGQEVSVTASAEAGLPGVKQSVAVTLKATAGQKFSHSKTEINSNEQTITLGGGSTLVEPGQRIDLRITVVQMNFTVRATNMCMIKTIDPDNFRKIEVRWDHNGFPSDSSINYTRGDEMAYEILNNINTIQDVSGNLPDWLHLIYGGSDYWLDTATLKANLKFDDENKKVFLVEQTAVMQGSSGLTVVSEYVDATSQKVYTAGRQVVDIFELVSR